MSLAWERHSEDCVPHDEHIRFEVEDTGIGIAPEQLEKIFLPFEQVGDTKHCTAGAGLGLAIARQFARLMGSDISVKSEVGRGSVFWCDLELPVADHAVTPGEVTRPHIIGYRGVTRKVLLVDDQPENLAVLWEMLVPLGFETLSAASGEEAIENAVHILPDLVLMDLIMPGMDGFETIRRLRRIPELQETIILTVSADAFEQTGQKSRAAGSNGFLAKPLHEEELLTLLEHHLHLEWVCAEENEFREDDMPAEAQSLVLPSQEILEQLHHLAMLGDVTRLKRQLTTIETEDVNLIPFVVNVQHLVNIFQFEQLQALLESYLNNPGGDTA
jgi:CheY-like chemotaxis protein